MSRATRARTGRRTGPNSTREAIAAAARSLFAEVGYDRATVRAMVASDMLRLAASLTDDRPDLRATLIGSQVVGIAVARYVVLVEPLCSISARELVDVLAPSFQH